MTKKEKIKMIDDIRTKIVVEYYMEAWKEGRADEQCKDGESAKAHLAQGRITIELQTMLEKLAGISK